MKLTVWQIRLIKVTSFVRLLLARPFYALKLLRYRVVPAFEHAALLRRVRPKYIVDVGANRGQFSTMALLTLGPTDLTVIEPLEEAFRILKNVLPASADIHPVAVGSEMKNVPLHVTASSDSSSLLRPTRAQEALSRGGARVVGQNSVDVLPLSQLLSADTGPSRLLKIDVQGTELDVLRGLGDRLESFEVVLVESSFDHLYQGQHLAGEVVAYMIAHGFQLIAVEWPWVSSGRVVQADLVFERNKSDTVQ